MFVQAVFVAFREYYNIDPSYTDEITVLCILEYYIYLSSVYRQELTEKLSQKEIELKKKELDVLRGQIQPHFIYNTLNIIRSLARTNSPETV
jgi:LytS/YehU family sensor histidine kinase